MTIGFEDSPLKLVPGQWRPLNFRALATGALPTALDVRVTYVMKRSPGSLMSTTFSHTLSVKDIRSPHKFTFHHPSGIISYAIIRAPSKRVCQEVDPGSDLPIILSLHGAGLEADSHEVRHTLDSLPDLPSWVLFPTGVTSWSGDDWRPCRPFARV